MCPPLPQWPQKSLLCGPQPTHVATTASCWSSVYPCNYDNTLLVLSTSVKPNSPLLWSSQPTPVTNKEARLSSVYSCIIIALCVSLVYNSFHKKPHLLLSQPYSHHIISSGPQSTLVAIKTPVATTAVWRASVFPITALYVVSATPNTTKSQSSGPQPTSEATTAPWLSSAYPCSYHNTLLVHR